MYIKILRQEWGKLTLWQQDNTWEFLLIADFVPIIPWLGKIETYYGVLQCAEKEIIENGPNKS